MYLGFASQWSAPTALVLGAVEPLTAVTDPAQRAALPSAVEQMLYLDLVTYLPDDVLTKLDRASMGVSLEARVPLLDHRVVEFAWSIPLALKIRDGQSKWVLRQILDRHVPPALTDRPKTGFAMPLDAWLRGPLRPWAESLLDRRRLRDEGFLDATVVHTHWMTHLSGRKNLSDQLWNVLMFQAWLDARRCDTAPAHSERHLDVVGAVP
jgi:asparagine synthase (glutamine-hydrolysing)